MRCRFTFAASPCLGSSLSPWQTAYAACEFTTPDEPSERLRQPAAAEHGFLFCGQS